MAIDERARHQLHTRLAQTIGDDQASTLMEHLPPRGWADVATRHDLEQLEARLDTRFDARFDGLRSEMHQLVTGLRGEMHQLITELRGEMHAESSRSTRVVVFSMIGSNATLVALAFTAARLA